MEDSNESSPQINRSLIVSVLLFGGFVAVLNQTLLNTAIPNIMDDFGITTSEAQWLTTGFLLINGIMIPITAFLIEKFTTRHLFFFAMSLFVIGTFICSVAPYYFLLVSGRLVQASGAGIMIPLLQTVLFMIFPPHKRGAAMGLMGLVISFAPAIGPTLSGWLVEQFSWRTIFYVLLLFGIIDIVFAKLALKNVTKQTNPKLDYLSIILSSLGFGGLLYGFSIVGEKGWTDSVVVITLVIGTGSLTLFIWRQITLTRPLLEFRVFKFKMFSLTTLIGMITMMAMLGAELLIPIYLQNMRDFTALESGLLLLPGAVIMGLMAPVIGKIFDKIGAKWLSIIGLGMVTITTYQFTMLTETTSYLFIMYIYAIRMIGITMVMTPTMTAGLNSLPNRWIAHGSAMNNTMRIMAGSVGTAILVTVLSKESDRYLQTSSGNKMPNAELQQQAMIHGINTAFLVATAIAVLGILLSLFIKDQKVLKKKDE
jgi:EmrB/QacA subfamily drug resistance transporter